MALTVDEWSAGIAQQVGRNVRYFREEGAPDGRKVTAQALADRCTELGLAMDRTFVAKLEKGTRGTLTIGQLIVLARALRVSPVTLLFPIGRQDSVEILPGKDVAPFEALLWFTGEADALPDDDGDQPKHVEPVTLYRDHQRLVDAFRDRQAEARIVLAAASTSMRADDFAGVDRSLNVAGRMLRSAEEPLRKVRQRLREAGLTPPPLSEDMASIDKEENA